MIKIILWIVLAFLIALNSYATGQEKIAEYLFVEMLTPDVYLFNHEFPWPANSLVVRKGETVILIDTPYTSEATQQMVEWIRGKWNPTEMIAVNTGFHVDDLGGNAYLRKEGISIYGSKLTCELLDEKGEASRELLLSWLAGPANRVFYDGHNEPYFKPTCIFEVNSDGCFELLEGSIWIYYPGESHSPDNFVVYLPESKLLFGGCMVKSLDSKNLGNTADANLAEWLFSVRKVLQRFKEAQIVVPGHGRWGDAKLLHHTLKLCQNRL